MKCFVPFSDDQLFSEADLKRYRLVPYSPDFGRLKKPSDSADLPPDNEPANPLTESASRDSEPDNPPMRRRRYLRSDNRQR